MIIVDDKEKEILEWDKMFDDEYFREMKSNVLVDVFYIEKVILDVIEILGVMKLLVSEFDMIVVGRGKGRKSVYMDGFEEWSEFKEFGVIGDLLILYDINF